jgi:hypothetical protein
LFWRLLIEEFAPTFHYITGESNTCADAFSRLPTVTEAAALPEEQESDAFALLANCFVHLPDDDPEFGTDLFGYNVNCFPVLQPPPTGLPIAYEILQERQQQEQRIMDYLNDANRYELRPFPNNTQLACRLGDSQLAPARIVIPDSLLKPIVLWYHERLGHAGSRRLYDTVASLFYHGERLKATAESTVTRCRICQEVKPPEHVIGQLAPREAPWLPGMKFMSTASALGRSSFLANRKIWCSTL